MLEILLIYLLCSKIGKIVRDEKGYESAIGYQVLTVVLWIGGEFVGGFVGGLISGVGPRGEPDMCSVYGLALVGAALGATISYTIANNLQPARSRTKAGELGEASEYFDPNRKPASGDNPFKDWPSDKFQA
jgi:hypothetical protein